jgi:hypothetical protein
MDAWIQAVLVRLEAVPSETTRQAILVPNDTISAIRESSHEKFLKIRNWFPMF